VERDAGRADAERVKTFLLECKHQGCTPREAVMELASEFSMVTRERIEGQLSNYNADVYRLGFEAEEIPILLATAYGMRVFDAVKAVLGLSGFPEASSMVDTEPFARYCRANLQPSDVANELARLGLDPFLAHYALLRAYPDLNPWRIQFDAGLGRAYFAADGGGFLWERSLAGLAGVCTFEEVADRFGYHKVIYQYQQNGWDGIKKGDHRTFARKVKFFFRQGAHGETDSNMIWRDGKLEVFAGALEGRSIQEAASILRGQGITCDGSRWKSCVTVTRA
jgi:hypothetical protein